MNKYYYFLLLLISSPFLSWGQNLSLPQAIQLMEENNNKLKGYEKQTQAAEYEMQATKGLLFPKVTMSGKAVHLNEALSLNLNKYRYGLSYILNIKPEVLGTNWSIPFQEPVIMTLQADLKWPIFTGGKIKAANEAAKIKRDLTLTEQEKVKSELISEVSNRYFQVQLAQEAVLVRKQAQEAAEKHLYNATQLEKNGIIATVERMQAETAVSDAQREWKAAQKDVDLALTALQGILNISTNHLSLNTPLFEVDLLQPLEYYQQQAKENYPEIAKAKLKKQLAEQNINLKKSNFMPDIAIIGSKYLLAENLPITEPDWYVGIGMQVDVFTGLKNKNEYKQAIAMSKSVDLLQAQAEKDIQTLVKKQYIEILKQQQQIESLKKNIAFAEELVRVRNKAFYEGFAKSTDVVDANLYLASIRMKKLKALYEMDKTLAEMLETCGLSSTLTQYLTQ